MVEDENRKTREAVAIIRRLAKAVETTIINGKKRAVDKRTVGFYQSTLEKLNKCWETYNKAYTELQGCDVDADELDTLEQQCIELDLKYSDYLSDLYDGVAEKTAERNEITQPRLDVTQQQQHPSSNVQLPRIQLPKFDGNYDDWRAFRDLFVSVVHNDKNIEPVQKLHYLKSCLTKDAERLLKNIPITNEDYIPAWEKLKSRFENKRILINTQVKRLINQEKLKTETSKGLQTITDVTEECLQQIKILGVDVSTWDILLIHILVKRLPVDTIKLWEEELGNDQSLPTLKQLINFLQTRARILECVSSTIGATSATQHQTRSYHVSKKSEEPRCPACQEGHYVTKCEEFKKMDINKKRQCILQSKRCFNCFSSKHTANKCTSKFKCRKCDKKHHTFLHVEGHTSEMSSNGALKEASSGSSQIQNFFNTKYTNALLATAQVAIKDQQGQIKKVRCLIDPGSQASFITERMAKRLGLRRSPIHMEVSGLNGSQTAWAKCQATAQLISCINHETTIEADLLVIKTIAESLPTHSVSEINNKWKYLQGLQLADPLYWKAGPVDVLLGAEHYTQILQNEIVKGNNGGPTAINTLFGWILLGGNINNTTTQSFVMYQDKIEEINHNIQRFWESEEVQQVSTMTEDEIQCEKHFESTHIRCPNGQYQVRLPFKQPPNLGSSRDQALRRFQVLRRKFENNKQFKEEYTKCFDEYISLGHMSEIIGQGPSGYYIPHHAVFKDSTTTKLRIVFDASAKSSNKKSLNEQLLTGPTLQPKLFATLLRWRKHKIAITGDIEKMYRMIQIHPDDRRYQRVIWEDKNSNEIRDFQLHTVTFGTTSAPYLAVKTLQQLAKDEKEHWPLASKVVMEDFYVDDLLSGADNIEKAKGLRNQCIQMLKRGSFNLRKWSSNKIELLSDLPKEDIEMKDCLQFHEDASVKTLGIKWIPKTDTFCFCVKNKEIRENVTKRSILSEIASLYDPLGWIAPVVVRAKMLMQEIWISGCSWDEEVSPTLKQKWLKFKTQLTQIEMVKIPRWVGYTTTITTIQLHGFSDASMQAYGAVIYFCVEVNNERLSTLLTAKTKVASIKPVTIPRLELCGALLLAKLLKQTSQDMGLEAHKLVAWTDSTIALHWIKSHPRKWKTYVANRVAAIQELVKPECWRYVSTKHNPADVASRGEEISTLLTNRLWWNGPIWLTQQEQDWPASELLPQKVELEASNKPTITLSVSIDESMFIKYSSFQKLKRIIATMRRFINNCKNSNNKLVGPLTVVELNEASMMIFKQIQKIHFKEEYYKLNKEQEISSKSKLIQLRPFLDEHKVLRVGGRLQQADIAYDQRHPIILPASHHVTTIIIRETHQQTLHGGTSLVLNTTRQLYWIMNAKRTISNQINHCPTCIRYRKMNRYQLMGELPADRINISRTFENVGIDYAGPIFVKTAATRNAKCLKAYFCIFICMATKAIHIEAVSSLSTEAFLAALKRFIARRGVCKTLYSDCGTNFKGARTILDKELKDAIERATTDAEKECINKYSIQWKFNPPGAPHFGGIWEANVKSVKYHLLRVVGNQNFTFEEFSTLLAQIEAILNSRPLCKIENSTEDLEVLTPGHFLIGQPLNALPEQNYSEDGTLHRRWKHIQLMTQQFWKKWSRDYLNTLQQRPKWYKPQPNLKIGDIVILKDDQKSPTLWPLGRITKTYPGKDGQIRVVDVETATNQYTRPITKIYPLPMDTTVAH